MESRREERVPANKSIVLTVLEEPEVRLPAVVKDASARGLGMIAAAPVRPGAAVKIEIADAIFLGEAVHCHGQEEGWLIGVRLHEVLSGLAALNRMAQEFEAFLHPAAVR